MEQPDIAKAARQHLEMDAFFTGDFALKSSMKHVSTKEYDLEKNEKLQKIAAVIAKCQKCELAQTRTNVVPGEGDPNARIVFVGEAPGADEDVKGRPFVGRAGQLLEKIIIAMGLQRDQVFICNTLKCRPPGNRDPKPDEIVFCQPYLKQQLEIIAPEIIVALGAHAAKTLLNTNKPIGQL
ncbi:MAG: uracil-DNA glycosylase, partial [Anaerohalosphaera sp.]|nr:uracil-DNA glycosylase [Anaerohalosphaera sp.]